MAEPKWMKRVDALVGGLAARCHRRPFATLALLGLLCAAGFWGSRSLSVNADLTSLLPRSFQSVRDLDKLRARFGGIGYVVVSAQGGTPESLRKFAEDVAPQLARIEGIRFVEYKRATEFFQDRALYYMDLGDLQEVERRIKAREKWERRQRNPLLLNLGDEEPAPPLDFSDIEQKYKFASNARLAGEGEAYYLDPKVPMVVLLCKPDSVSVDLAYSRVLVGRVERFLAGLDLKQYGAGVTTSITGTYKKKIDQQELITRDVATASTIATILMLLYLILHFRSLLAVAFVLVPVGVGLTWTYGLVAVLYGQVTILTAFGGAILGGLGTEHGIHLTGRYTTLRAQGLAAEEAVREAFSHTGGSALVSAFVGAFAFFSLGISEFRAFSEFGVIAGAGMLIVVGASLTTLPAFLGVLDRFGWKPTSSEAVSGRRSFVAALLPRHPLPVFVGVAAMVVVLIGMMRFTEFDYNLNALQDCTLPSFKLDQKINKILGFSQIPVVVLTDEPGEERHVVKQVVERKKKLGAASTVDFVAALDDLVPEQQSEKQELLRSIGAVLARVNRKKLEPKFAERFDQLLRMTAVAPFTREDIPASVRRQFESVSKLEGGFVLIFPKVGIDEGAAIHAIAREVRQLSRPSGAEVAASGELMILSDILEMVRRESYPVLFAALAAVLLTMWLTLGSLRSSLACMTPTVVSILALLGLMPLADFKLNFLNVIAIPVLIGTTVDAGVHLISRLADAHEVFEPTFAETGRSIIGGLITSAVGFGAMIWADHPGLRSLGALTILGFSVNLVVMLLGFPSFLLLRRPKPKVAPASGGP